MMKLLLDANRDAPSIEDNVRPLHAHISIHPPARCYPTYRGCALQITAMQDEKLPLHHAAMSGAPFDVMKLLLDANPEAATAVAQARADV